MDVEDLLTLPSESEPTADVQKDVGVVVKTLEEVKTMPPEEWFSRPIIVVKKGVAAGVCATMCGTAPPGTTPKFDRTNVQLMNGRAVMEILKNPREYMNDMSMYLFRNPQGDYECQKLLGLQVMFLTNLYQLQFLTQLKSDKFLGKSSITDSFESKMKMIREFLLSNRAIYDKSRSEFMQLMEHYAYPELKSEGSLPDMLEYLSGEPRKLLLAILQEQKETTRKFQFDCTVTQPAPGTFKIKPVSSATDQKPLVEPTDEKQSLEPIEMETPTIRPIQEEEELKSAFANITVLFKKVGKWQETNIQNIYREGDAQYMVFDYHGKNIALLLEDIAQITEIAYPCASVVPEGGEPIGIEATDELRYIPIDFGQGGAPVYFPKSHIDAAIAKTGKAYSDGGGYNGMYKVVNLKKIVADPADAGKETEKAIDFLALAKPADITDGKAACSETHTVRGLTEIVFVDTKKPVTVPAVPAVIKEVPGVKSYEEFSKINVKFLRPLDFEAKNIGLKWIDVKAPNVPSDHMILSLNDPIKSGPIVQKYETLKQSIYDRLTGKPERKPVTKQQIIGDHLAMPRIELERYINDVLIAYENLPAEEGYIDASVENEYVIFGDKTKEPICVKLTHLKDAMSRVGNNIFSLKLGEKLPAITRSKIVDGKGKKEIDIQVAEIQMQTYAALPAPKNKTLTCAKTSAVKGKFTEYVDSIRKGNVPAPGPAQPAQPTPPAPASGLTAYADYTKHKWKASGIDVADYKKLKKIVNFASAKDAPADQLFINKNNLAAGATVRVQT